MIMTSEFKEVAARALVDLEQYETALANGDESIMFEARHLLKDLIDASDRVRLMSWVRAVRMVAEAVSAETG
jgi:hypothetical protein